MSCMSVDYILQKRSQSPRRHTVASSHCRAIWLGWAAYSQRCWTLVRESNASCGANVMYSNAWCVSATHSNAWCVGAMYSNAWCVSATHSKAWCVTHSGHRFPAPSSKLCQNWLRHWRGTLYLPAAVHRRGPASALRKVWVLITLRASLSCRKPVQ